MTNPNNWPGEPGYPLNPERDGAHMICAHAGIPGRLMLWNSASRMWVSLSSQSWTPEYFAERNWQYLGPCIPLGEQYAAGYAQGAADARKADVACLRGFATNRGDDYAACVQSLPLPQSKPDQDALSEIEKKSDTELIAEAKAEGRGIVAEATRCREIFAKVVGASDALTGDVQRERARIAGIIQQMIDARRARAGMDIGVESIQARTEIGVLQILLGAIG